MELQKHLKLDTKIITVLTEYKVMAEICEKSLDNLPTFQGFFSFTFLFVTNAEKVHVKLIHTFFCKPNENTRGPVNHS